MQHVLISFLFKLYANTCQVLRISMICLYILAICMNRYALVVHWFNSIWIKSLCLFIFLYFQSSTFCDCKCWSKILHWTKRITFDVHRYNSISYHRISTQYQDLICIQYENEYDHFILRRNEINVNEILSFKYLDI